MVKTCGSAFGAATLPSAWMACDRSLARRGAVAVFSRHHQDTCSIECKQAVSPKCHLQAVHRARHHRLRSERDLPSDVGPPGRGGGAAVDARGMAWVLTVHADRCGRACFTPLITALAVPHRAKHGYWHLILSGAAALPAVRRDLTHSNADVRMYCARALDHLVDETAYPAVIAALDDGDPRVREEALHALACDRCKDNACRPEKADVLPRGMQLLRTDPDRRVRAFAAEVSAAGSTRIQTPRPRSSKPVARIRIRRCGRKRLGTRRAVPSTVRRGQRRQRPQVARSSRSVDIDSRGLACDGRRATRKRR